MSLIIKGLHNKIGRLYLGHEKDDKNIIKALEEKHIQAVITLSKNKDLRFPEEIVSQ